MERLELLQQAESQLARVIHGLTESEMELVSNCPPWTVRRLASHVLKNQLFWAGSVSGRELMTLDEAMAAVPYDGDPTAISRIADDVVTDVLALWRDPAVMTSEHPTPFGELPGTVVIDFAIIDAAAHAWDLSASVGRAIEFPDEAISAMWEVVGHTCTEHTVEIGLIKPPTQPPADATETERMMALAGRTIPR